MIWSELANKIFQVTFVKQNGQLRTMTCTLFKPGEVDLDKLPDIDKEPLLVVWEINERKFKSFYKSSVTELNILELC